MKVQFRDELLKCIQNYPILYVPHFHQKFICDEIQNVCRRLFTTNKGDVVVTTIEGSHKELEDLYNSDKVGNNDYVDNIINRVARHICNVRENVDYSSFICVIKDLDSNLLNDSRFVSLIHEFVEYYEDRSKLSPYYCLSLVLCVPSCEMPPQSISGISYVVNVSPPDGEDIRQELTQVGMEGSNNDIMEYIRALQGLYLFDIRQIIRSTKNTYGRTISPSAIRWAYEEKQELVRRTGVLEVVDPDVSLRDIGGLGNLKKDIEDSATLYKNLSILREANVPIPKGYLLLGMPGCGKSMIAKATAAEFGCPLLKLDMGKLLGKYVGDSEHNLQIALDVVDSAHPCVLWIDEIEKAFAGTNNSSSEGDSVMMRLMGRFLSWMQERKTAVFIMATANDVLKPELMRKGRFDEVYFVDFPTAKEAEEIIVKTVNKYSKLGDENMPPLGIFSKEYIQEIAIAMTTSQIGSNCNGCDNLKKCNAINNRCLSGAEIKTFIDSFVAKQISELIKNANDKNHINLKDLFISKKYFEKQLVKAKESAMINQRNIKCQKELVKIGEGAKMTFIDKIYEFRDKYNFKSASLI